MILKMSLFIHDLLHMQGNTGHHSWCHYAMTAVGFPLKYLLSPLVVMMNHDMSHVVTELFVLGPKRRQKQVLQEQIISLYILITYSV